MTPHQDTTDQYSFILAPSKIAGIGVHTTHKIKKGTYLTLFTTDVVRLIPYDSPELNSPLIKNFCIWYCVEAENGYSCPTDFRHMDIGWFLNHSKHPNAYHDDYKYYALNDIEEGAEILIDYETLSELPQSLKPITIKK